MKINRLILFAFILVLISLSAITAESITTSLPSSEESLFDRAEKTYELSQNSIISGHTLSLVKNSMIVLPIFNRKYYLFVSDISPEEIILLNPKNESLVITINDSKIIEITDSITGNKAAIEFRLESISDKKADLHIQDFGQKIPVNVDYTELFDIIVSLKKDIIYSPDELLAYIKFINFGEGPSHIIITYSVMDKNGKEYYQAVDSKVVYTEDSVVKTFDSLSLPFGEYALYSRIDYGKNQTAESESSFKLIRKPLYIEAFPVAVFFIVVAGLYAFASNRMKRK